MPFIFGRSVTWIKTPKQPSVPFYHAYKKLFIVQLIVCGEVVQVDHGGEQFLVLLRLLVHQNRGSVLWVFVIINNFINSCVYTYTLLIGCT